tara:strand:+ start:44 stop:334 length:291 start_codon:yes stop_codon:yes gene_type:complete
MPDNMRRAGIRYQKGGSKKGSSGTALKDALIKAGYQGGGSVKVEKPLVQMTLGGGADMVGALIEGSQAAMAREGKEIYGTGGSYGSMKPKKKKKKR